MEMTQQEYGPRLAGREIKSAPENSGRPIFRSQV